MDKSKYNTLFEIMFSHTANVMFSQKTRIDDLTKLFLPACTMAVVHACTMREPKYQYINDGTDGQTDGRTDATVFHNFCFSWHTTMVMIRRLRAPQITFSAEEICCFDDVLTDRRTNGRTDGRTDARTGGRTDGRTDGGEWPSHSLDQHLKFRSLWTTVLDFSLHSLSQAY